MLKGHLGSGENYMESHLVILKQIGSYLKHCKEIPYIQIFDENDSVVQQFYHHSSMKNISANSSWQAHMQLHHSYRQHLLSNNRNPHIFIGIFGFVYSIKTLYQKENCVGTIIFGGFRLPNTAYSHLTQQLNIEMNELPKVLEIQQFKQLIAKMDRKIDAIAQQADELFLEILSWLKEEMHRIITVNEICRKYFVSSSYLRRIFLKYTNQSFKKTYFEMKLEYGYLLHKTTFWSHKKIAESLGYYDNHQFIKKLKEYIQAKGYPAVSTLS